MQAGQSGLAWEISVYSSTTATPKPVISSNCYFRIPAARPPTSLLDLEPWPPFPYGGRRGTSWHVQGALPWNASVLQQFRPSDAPCTAF
ncbi:hypothetical protein Ndes2526A_g01334 [Nannochloris sp. 'desiccata']